MIKRIKSKIRKSDSSGLFHDSRQDIKILSSVCNELIEKVNELVYKVNELEGNKNK